MAESKQWRGSESGAAEQPAADHAPVPGRVSATEFLRYDTPADQIEGFIAAARADIGVLANATRRGDYGTALCYATYLRNALEAAGSALGTTQLDPPRKRALHERLAAVRAAASPHLEKAPRREGAASAGGSWDTAEATWRTAVGAQSTTDTDAAPAQPGAPSDDQVHAIAAQAVGGGGGALPFLDHIQHAFGRHDARSIVAHVGGEATAAAHAIGADAFAMGEHVAFARTPDLRTAAHEAAHVVQQRAGVPVAVGAAGDAHEQHADRVADLVARGQSAEAELDRYGGASVPGGGRVAVQRFVGPNLNAGDPVSINIAANAPGAVVRHHPGHGYDVQHAGGEQNFSYAQLDPRNAGAWVDQPVTRFLHLGDADAWVGPVFPDHFERALAGQPKLIVCAPSARGDMHDIRPALMMDAELKVIIAFHDDDSPRARDWRSDVNTIVGYYQGIPNFQQRVAVMNHNAGDVRDRLHAISASDSTRILRAMREQNGQGAFDQELTDATTGPFHQDDEFDCVRALMAAGFNPTASYVLVNTRESGHNPGHRPPSHPEHDSGAQGYWDMVRAVVLAGHVPVPMGAMPGLATWPGASLINYFNWTACQANARRNKRQAEYYLLAALKRFNPNVYALAWRSGVTDAISFAGIPVIALDVDNTVGHLRAQGREDLLGEGHYTQLYMSDRVAAEGHGGPRHGVAGWLGPLTRDDVAAIADQLGLGPDQPLVANLAHTPPQAQPQFGQPMPPPPEQALVVVRRFAAHLQTLAQTPGPALALAAQSLADGERQELVTGVAHARMAATWDLVEHMHGYVGQPPNTAPAQDATATIGVVQVGVVGEWLAYGARGHVPVLQRDDHTVLDQLDALWAILAQRVPQAVLALQQHQQHQLMLAQQQHAPQPFAPQGDQDMYDPDHPTD